MEIEIPKTYTKKTRKGFKSVKIEFYSSTHDMPITNYQEFQKLSMVDLGVGSSVEDFNKHFSKIHAYLKSQKNKEALLEMNNLYQGYWHKIQRISTMSLCLIPFIKSINGDDYIIGDLNKSRETLLNLSKRGLSNGHCEDILSEVKKKLLSNWNPVFLVNSTIQERKISTIQ